MSMVKKIYQAKKSMQEKSIWGIRVNDRIKKRCQLVAALMGVPVSDFVSFIINYWFDDNIDLLENEQVIKQLAGLVKGYHCKKLNLKLPGRVILQSPGEDDVVDLKNKWSLRGVSIETKLRIKAMALNSGIPIGKFIDVMTAREWKRAGNKSASPRLSQKLRKDIIKFLFP